MTKELQAHWNKVYADKHETEVSWFQETPDVSLDLIATAEATPEHAIIDIGGGASRLVDALLARAFQRVTVLDLSHIGLERAQDRLGEAARTVTWLVADATTWEPPQTYDIWHDRAVFHFLNEEKEQQAYLDRLRRSLSIGGRVIFGTFAPEGPEKCSGLPVTRHDSASLSRLLGPAFTLTDNRRHDHQTPWGSRQAFQFSTFQRMA